MEKHWKDLNKSWISKYQKLSDDFIIKHSKDLDLKEILKREDLKLSEDVRTFLKMKL